MNSRRREVPAPKPYNIVDLKEHDVAFGCLYEAEKGGGAGEGKWKGTLEVLGPKFPQTGDEFSRMYKCARTPVQPLDVTCGFILLT